MFSSAIVVFREVFEIVLIVGIVLAATKTMPHRKKAIALGFGGGIFGAALVALFTDAISNMAEGVGQEYFNAGVLFAAAAFIGWTVLWMKKHGRHMKTHFQSVGRAVSDGRAPFFTLSAIIALAMLREGSEIVLFTYGMLASGQPALSLAAGAAIGVAGGAAVGILLYMGLIRLSMKIFFQVTSALLIFLVAGMMSQAFGFLVAAGAFESLSRTAWDSSSLLNDNGMLGKSLNAMFGYTARPAAIQVIVYVLTLGTLMMLMRLIEKDFKFARAGQAAAALLLAGLPVALTPAQAQAGKKIYSPYVEQGELEAEWRGSVTHDGDDDEADGAWEQKLGVGYGVNDWLFLEAYGEVEKENGEDTTFSAVEFEGKIQLTDPGAYWMDVGLLGEYEINTDGGPDEAGVKLLLAKDTGMFSHMANLGLGREVGRDSEDATEASVAWSTRYRFKPVFEPGFEIYSDFGSLSDGSSFDDEKHQAGPVFYGQAGPLKYDVGYLVGLSDSSPDGEGKINLEYEWRF